MRRASSPMAEAVPELPEVEALAADLRGRLVGRVIRRVDVTEIAALKTFDPSVGALRGHAFASAGRHHWRVRIKNNTPVDGGRLYD